MHRVLIVSGGEPSAVLSETVLWRTSLSHLVIPDVDAALVALEPGERPLVVLDGMSAHDAEQAVRRLRLSPLGRDLCVAVVAPDCTGDEEKSLRRSGATVVLCGEPNPLAWDFRLTRALHVPPRLDERVPVYCRVMCHVSPTEVIATDAVNLSERGVLLKAPQPFGVGARIDLEVILPDGANKVPLGGQVVREEQMPDGSVLVAVEFVLLPSPSREALVAQLAEARRS